MRSVFLLLFEIGNLSLTIDAEIVQHMLTQIIMKATKNKIWFMAVYRIHKPMLNKPTLGLTLNSKVSV